MRHFVTIRKGETTSSSDNGKKLMNGSTGTANSQKKSSTGSTSLRPTPPALANPATGGSKANVPALSTPEAATVQKVGLGTVFSRESASCKSSISNKTQMLASFTGRLRYDKIRSIRGCFRPSSRWRICERKAPSRRIRTSTELLLCSSLQPATTPFKSTMTRPHTISWEVS